MSNTVSTSGYTSVKERIDNFVYMQLPQFLECFPDVTGKERNRYEEEVHGYRNTERLTVATTGTMKLGKSTLINALIDRNLPTTGITEATATLNYIEHLDKSRNRNADIFYVRWTDGNGPDQEFEMEEFRNFIGEKGREQQDKVDRITMFADADFLKKIVLIDTPGEKGTQLKPLPVKPDALIRCFDTVGGENDIDMLEKFAEESRVLGSSPYNTVGVMQKWETTWPSGDKREDTFKKSPLYEADEAARLLEISFENGVATVMPVSGLLWGFSSNVSDQLLDATLVFCNTLTESELIKSVQGQRKFQRLEEGKKSSIEEQTKLELGRHSSAAWPVIKMMIWCCVAEKPQNAAELRHQLKSLSNMDAFRELLQSRFFDRAEVLKMKVGLNDALKISMQADYKLTQYRDLVDEDIRNSAAAVRELENISSSFKQDMPVTVEYLKSSQTKLEQVRSRLDSVISKFQGELNLINGISETLTKDLDWLEKIGTDKDLREELQERQELEKCKALFGNQGGETYKRLGFIEEPDAEALSEKLFEEYRYWKEAEYASHLAQHAQLVVDAKKRLDNLRAL